MSIRRIPLATYRLQLNQSFTFSQAREIVPYLHALGISDCYFSPIMKAMPGSDHGYDVIDPAALNPELGTEEQFFQLAETIQNCEMGILLDVVPNHMGIGKTLNRWWRDVLENGPSSRYATAFDIDWHPIKRELQNKVLLPILGDQYGTVLENQEISVVFHDGEFGVRYGDHELPLTPKSWGRILARDLETLIREIGESEPSIMELQSIMTALKNLPGSDEQDEARLAERYREVEVIKKRLATLVRSYPAIRNHLEANVTALNGMKGQPATFDELDAMLDEQAYRLASWKVASEEVNYRRFFDINDLAAIRMENPAVFQESHDLLFRLMRHPVVTGLRIDHVDGLYDPGDYLRQLHERAQPHFIVVEKILGKDEPLPGSWPVQGTTGYDFINLVNGLFVQRSNERAFSDLYHRIAGRKSSYADTVYASKQLIMRVAMASQINVLGHRLDVLSERDRRSRDFTLNSLRNAIREIIACFPVYRTYVTDGPEPVTERDREYIHLAVARAKRRNHALSGQVFDFIRSILLKQGDARKPEDRDEQIRFVMKLQQITSPVTAKGVEDTALYRFNRLVSLNEVGGEPDRFGVLLEEFHKQMQERRARWPYALSASSTHDTKRSEDVRARINVLSEMPVEWKTKVRRWNQLNQKHRCEVEGERLPSRNDEYLFYQTLIGTWPMHAMGDLEYREYCSRIQQYMEKAIHEAKEQTSWVNPNVVYDQAVHDFIERALDRMPSNAFLQEFVPFQERIAHYGLFNSLAQVMLKITAPGIPDFYQGTELWDFSLVDPDNRRPVDYADRFKLLHDLRRSTEQQPHRAECVLSLANHARDGRLKLYTIMTGLDFRRAHADLFQQGEYLPLETGGIKKQHICAFARLFNSHAAITVVPRLLGTLTQDVKNPPIGPAVWDDTWIAVPPWPTFASYRNLVTGEVLTTESANGHRVLPIGQVFGRCPVALLERL